MLANDSERSEAGEEYNEYTIQFLKDRMEATGNQQYMTKKNLLQGINDYIQENLNKYFVENFGEKSLCGEFRDNEVNMFMDTETKPVLKKNPVISEWKLIWDAKYELDYDVLKWEDDVNNKSGVIVKVDLPGVCSGRPSKAAHKKPEKQLRTYACVDRATSLGTMPAIDRETRKERWVGTERGSSCNPFQKS